MVDISVASVLAVTKETTAGTYVAPGSSDAIQVADLKATINGIQVNLNEFTGSVHAPGPAVIGSTFEISGKIFLRGPGGSTPPSADAWNPGRILQAAGFAETVTSSAVPSSPEALGAGTTTQITLGSSAVGTTDLYKGMLVNLAQLGTIPAGLTMLRSYASSKVALLAETAGSALNTSNYQIPKQLSYRLSGTTTAPTLSAAVWMGSRRYNGSGMAISAFKINLPTASRDAQEMPSIEFTLSGNLESEADEAAPTVTVSTSVPPFRGGDFWIDKAQFAGSSFTVDLNAEVAYEPDANKASGNGPAVLTKTQRVVSFTLSQVAKATKDWSALAASQAQTPFMAIWGLGTGNYFGLIVTDARLNYRSPDNSGPLVNTTGEAYVDGTVRDIALCIPFY